MFEAEDTTTFAASENQHLPSDEVWEVFMCSDLSSSMQSQNVRWTGQARSYPLIHIHTHLKYQQEPHLYEHAYICIICTGKLTVNQVQVKNLLHTQRFR